MPVSSFRHGCDLSIWAKPSWGGLCGATIVAQPLNETTSKQKQPWMLIQGCFYYN